jgi:DNA-binding XRE family transcriptional regulator
MSLPSLMARSLSFDMRDSFKVSDPRLLDLHNVKQPGPWWAVMKRTSSHYNKCIIESYKILCDILSQVKVNEIKDLQKSRKYVFFKSLTKNEIPCDKTYTLFWRLEMSKGWLADLVKEERKRLGLSQETLARQVGVHSNTIYRIEQGEKRVSFFKVEKVLSELGWEIDVHRYG